MRSRHAFLHFTLPFSIFTVGMAFGGEKIDFNRQIRPILSNACIGCHGPDEAERKGGSKTLGGLRLDTESGARQLHDGVAAIVPGKPEQSELLKRIVSTDADEVMPPASHAKPLTPPQIQLLKEWISQGANYDMHWAYKLPQRFTPPHSGHPVDAFLQDRMKAAGLEPQAEADRATLARRLSLDLVGLPPRREEVETFVADPAPQNEAVGRYVDTLLTSPAYGEHWAREWLDLARYADSAGYADDPSRSIWGFRDYVIKSFNANKPFDQFTIEQLAGDLLPKATEEQLIATAFHRNTMTNSEGGTNDEEFRSAAIVDRVNTTLGVWMGTSMACAQCHTHKYDPITQHEYFQVYAFFNNTEDADRRDESPFHSFISAEDHDRKATLEKDLAAAQKPLQSQTDAQRLASLAWAKSLAKEPKWTILSPKSATSRSGLPTKILPENGGSVLVSKSAPKDTLTVKLAVEKDTPITALRLDALTHPELPGNGPGHAGGNFVLTKVTATLHPPDSTAPPKARFVRIELPGKERILQLAEVEVFSGGKNIAPKGTATQESTYDSAVAAKANDGNTNAEYDRGSVAHSGINAVEPWWEVDLKSEFALDSVKVWSRSELFGRIGGFHVIALDANRKVVWEKRENPAALISDFSLSNIRTVTFSSAGADFSQPQFAAAQLVEKKSEGWAIGGQQGKPHYLSLITKEQITMPAGSELQVRLEQESTHTNHLLGHVQLRVTDDPKLVERLALPANLGEILAKPAQDWKEQDMLALTKHWGAHLDPALAEARSKVVELEKALAKLPLHTVPILRELQQGMRRKTAVQIRGNFQNLGDPVEEGVPAVFHPLPQGEPRNRLSLAKWLMDPANPLTARVVANRYWEGLFGVGIVRTSEEFGTQGELPVHPELLDWLATELVRSKWDLKAFLKLLVTSQAYRQSSRVLPEALQKDPENRLVARGPRVRLSAEMVRDQALSVAGLLSDKMFGPSVRPPRPNSGLSAAFGGGLDWKTSDGEDRFRRGIYTEWRRTSPYPSMTTFDAPSREICTVRRSRSNTPLQAFVTLNDPVFVEASQGLARRLMREAGNTQSRLEQAFMLVLSRKPSAAEAARMSAMHAETLALCTADAQRAKSLATEPIGPVPADLKDVPLADLACWSVMAGVLLNLDETLMKR